jgi:hypothetical protein
MVLCENNAMTQKTVNSQVAYYLHVLLYKAQNYVYVLMLRSFRN